eukprot:7878108-Pyramimonas_sp.AAC.1
MTMWTATGVKEVEGGCVGHASRGSPILPASATQSGIVSGAWELPQLGSVIYNRRCLGHLCVGPLSGQRLVVARGVSETFSFGYPAR